MKYIHTSKMRNLILFFVLIFVAFSLNLTFFLMQESVIAYNLDVLLLFHLLLPVVYAVICCALFMYLLFTLEIIVLSLKDCLQLKVLTSLSKMEICAGIFIILFTAYHSDKIAGDIAAFLSKTIYFECLITTEDITNVYSYWAYVCLFSLIASSTMLFLAATRQFKTKKRIEANRKRDQLKTEVNRFLGFDYDNCDFHQQVNIPYESLQQLDGTRGEFEVYRMLLKSGLDDVKYIFNREIPKTDGLNTELDLIIVHKKGIFVVENKHYTTRIYGDALDHDLTIIDRNGNKKSIYNPIRQNENHVKALKEFLKSKNLYIDDEITPIHSIVVFTAEESDRTDDIISGISTGGTETKVCTSQNVSHIINQLIFESNSIVNINVSKIGEVLLNLPIRKKCF